MLCSAHLIPTVTGRRRFIEHREESEIKGVKHINSMFLSNDSNMSGILTSMFRISGPDYALAVRIDCYIFVQDPDIEFHV